jgi:dihydroorotate dehydrogenase (NAD+) catalytic subunit
VQDALEFIIAGASTVGLGTALFYDPLLCRTVNAGLAQYLDSQATASIAYLVGTLHMGVPVPGAAC